MKPRNDNTFYCPPSAGKVIGCLAILGGKGYGVSTLLSPRIDLPISDDRTIRIIKHRFNGSGKHYLSSANTASGIRHITVLPEDYTFVTDIPGPGTIILESGDEEELRAAISKAYPNSVAGLNFVKTSKAPVDCPMYMRNIVGCKILE